MSTNTNLDINTSYTFTCNNHKVNDNEVALRPPVYKCSECKKRSISGYSNPEHCSNPFGYLYLIPRLCLDCSNISHKCRWC